MARHSKSSEPISQVETQREGIMYEGLHSALGGIAVCVSYVEYFAGSNYDGSSLTAMLRNMATFPRTTLVCQPYSNSNEQCTGVNYLVWPSIMRQMRSVPGKLLLLRPRLHAVAAATHEYVRHSRASRLCSRLQCHRHRTAPRDELERRKRRQRPGDHRRRARRTGPQFSCSVLQL